MRTQPVCLALAVVLICPCAFGQWVQQNSGTTKNLYGVSFTDVNRGTVVGESGSILRTTDGGSTWTYQQVTAQTLRGVSFTDAIRGTVVGDSGTILCTTNGGVTWTSQSSGTSAQLRGVSFVDANMGTVVGGGLSESGRIDSCMILHTTNGGVTWTRQSSGTSAWLADVCFTDVNNGTAVGDTVILRTTNGGTTWTFQGNSGWQWELRAVSFPSAMTGIVVGYSILTAGQTILRTTDGGTSWSRIGLNLPWFSDLGSFNDVCFTDENFGTMVGMYGVGMPGFGVITHTTNGGASWTETTATQRLWGVCFADDKNGTVVGDSGTILRTTDGGVTGVIDKSLEIPFSISLKQNFPNPFNPTTTIKYELPKSSAVRLSVFDILGREVSVLVNERRNAGVYEVKFDGSELASGVYFYRLQAGDFVSTKRMLVLK